VPGRWKAPIDLSQTSEAVLQTHDGCAAGPVGESQGRSRDVERAPLGLERSGSQTIGECVGHGRRCEERFGVLPGQDDPLGLEGAGERGDQVAEGSRGVDAPGTALLGALPGAAIPAALALALFGCAFIALSGVLLAWGAQRTPAAAAAAVATLFIALTVGQALGSVALGMVTEVAGAPTAFLAASALLIISAAGGERRDGRSAAARRPGGTLPVVGCRSRPRFALRRDVTTEEAPHSG
jgi:hypothetical protein